MPPQFTLRALLVAVLVVAAFFGGMVVQRQIGKPELLSRTKGKRAYKMKGSKKKASQPIWFETIRLRDGTEWERIVDDVPSAP